VCANVILVQKYNWSSLLKGERIGAFHVVCEDKDEVAKVLSQLKIIIRPLYSNPPVHGARIVSEILGNKQLYEQWYKLI
jgi:aspartate aminotransferase